MAKRKTDEVEALAKVLRMAYEDWYKANTKDTHSQFVARAAIAHLKPKPKRGAKRGK